MHGGRGQPRASGAINTEHCVSDACFCGTHPTQSFHAPREVARPQREACGHPYGSLT